MRSVYNDVELLTIMEIQDKTGPSPGPEALESRGIPESLM